MGKEEGHIYAIGNTDLALFKIGVTRGTVQQRLLQIQSGVPFPVTLYVAIPVARRMGHEWSQAELARRAGVRAALISDLEQGKQLDTTAQNYRRLKRALGVELGYLYRDVNPEKGGVSNSG